MAKPPHNVHELMLALTRIAGNNIKAVEYRNLLAMTVVAQMLPKGSVVKDGSSLRVLLAANPKMSAAAIIEATGKSKSSVYNVLKKIKG